MSESRAPRALLTVLVLLVLGATVAAWFDLRRRTDGLAESLTKAAEAQERLERAVQLFRFERGSKGLGVAALIEQLRYWAPLLDVSTTPQHEIPRIKQRVDDILSAFGDLGADAFDPLLAAFHAAVPGKDDELIRWLLQAMTTVDAERGKDLLVKCLRGFELPVSARVRVLAANRLVELEPAVAARVLGQIVEYESASGIDPHRLPADLQARVAAAKVPMAPMRMFFNFIDALVRAKPENLEDQLIMVATRPNEDRMTVQSCVKYLGDLKSQRAVKALKRLYESPPEMTMNPIFQNHCLDAIGKIEGAAACDYFRDSLRRRPDETVIAKLQELIKTYCP